MIEKIKQNKGRKNMLVNTKEVFENAIKGKYAVGAFNFVNMEILQAILETAEEEKSPVIIQCSTGAIKYAGEDYLKGMVLASAEKVSVPVIWNLDHGKTFEDCAKAIELGFTNVMIDASSLPYEENVALTKRVVDFARSKGVTVEAELGVLAGVEDDTQNSAQVYTNPDQAIDFINKTNCDSLAIAIGTSHGLHKFSGEAKLRLDILKTLSERLPNYPFVLHGASSIPEQFVALANENGATLKNAKGVPEEMLHEACRLNICKVNVDSDLRICFTAGIRKYLNQNPSEVDLRKYLANGKKYAKDLIKHKMQTVLNSSNKA